MNKKAQLIIKTNKMMRNIVINMMIDEVIKKYGFENIETIKFCKVAEKNNFNLIKAYFHKIMK